MQAFDVLSSLFAIIILSPLFVVIAVLIKYHHRSSPVFYGVPVIGVRGRMFRMWKFSTMIPNAHLILDDLLAKDPALREEWEANYKLKNDPRVLPGVGNFLRRTSLNELPQLFNVLAGEMSLVGPRPITKKEVRYYLEAGGEELVDRRHSVRPGITGLWQCSGRSDVDYSERIALDVTYLDEKSLRADLVILLRTVGKVASRSGAY